VKHTGSACLVCVPLIDCGNMYVNKGTVLVEWMAERGNILRRGSGRSSVINLTAGHPVFVACLFVDKVLGGMVSEWGGHSSSSSSGSGSSSGNSSSN
jgi:hypothetical protein